MNETKPLNPKQDSFCVHYTTIGADTFSNGTTSAIAAGYSEKGAYVRGSELLRNSKVRERISELHAENMSRNNITTDSVLANIEHDRTLAREKGDISSAIRADELQGKYLAMFTDRTYVEDTKQKEIDDAIREQAAKLSASDFLVIGDAAKIALNAPHNQTEQN